MLYHDKSNQTISKDFADHLMCFKGRNYVHFAHIP